jgi:hypothetical protein
MIHSYNEIEKTGDLHADSEFCKSIS